jgi:hypothetical protein
LEGWLWRHLLPLPSEDGERVGAREPFSGTLAPTPPPILVRLAEGTKGVAEAVVRRAMVWLDGDGFGNQLDRLLGAALLVAQDAKKMQRVGIVGLGRQRFEIKRACLIQPACLMVRQCLLNKPRASRSRGASLFCCRAALLAVRSGNFHKITDGLARLPDGGGCQAAAQPVDGAGLRRVEGSPERIADRCVRRTLALHRCAAPLPWPDSQLPASNGEKLTAQL